MFNVLQISTGYSDGSAERAAIEAAGGTLTLIGSQEETDIIEAGRDAQGLLVTLTEVSGRLIEALPALQIIVRAGIGVDNIDLETARKRGVRVCNLPHYCQDEVADHTAALLLAMERKLVTQVNDLREGKWNPARAYRPIHGLRDRTVGFVGFGGIARKVADRLRPFGLRCIAADPYLMPEQAAGLGVELVSREELLARADFISLHLPLTSETYHLLDTAAFAKMKPNACIINTARGPLIDSGALYAALAAGKIAGAALDVVEGDLEGARRFAPFPNVLITPHSAYYSEQSDEKIRTQAGEVFARFIKGEPLDSAVV